MSSSHRLPDLSSARQALVRLCQSTNRGSIALNRIHSDLQSSLSARAMGISCIARRARLERAAGLQQNS